MILKLKFASEKQVAKAAQWIDRWSHSAAATTMLIGKHGSSLIKEDHGW
jgi:hypothetical protein